MMKTLFRKVKGRMQEAWKSHTKKFVYKESDRGATFVEIIVTISIILILMTSVGVAIFQWIPQAQIAATKQTMGSIKLGIDMYYTTKFEYPDSLADITEFLDPPQIPKDAWGNEFEYVKEPSDSIPYEIISLGQDGSQGGDGFAADISSIQSDDEDSDI